MTNYTNLHAFKRIEELYDFIILTCYNYARELGESEKVVVEPKKRCMDESAKAGLKTELVNTLVGIIRKYQRARPNQRHNIQ